MALLVSLLIGVMVTCGVYLLLRARTFAVVMGLIMLSYAVNLFLFAMGRLAATAPSLVGLTGAKDVAADPVPQALVLTAIVIGFAMTAFAVTLALRANSELGSDHVDGAAPDSSAKESAE
ncbi:MAG: Na+/H+ antiporter subunit C [Gammaproteobacteria bacterium]|nr:Na+/H+ antiporter subunit C [Gammaproteobacteria bacterium]